MDPLLVAVVVVALIFDYTNGFHDAANAVATSISTRALPPNVALAGAAALNVIGALVSTHVAATQALGAGPWYLLTRHVLPAVLPPVARHALIRVPGIALSLAALSFLGLGAQPPAPEWGLLLAENQPYAERAPWAVLAPAAVLALLGAFAVTAAGGVRWPWQASARPRRVPPAPTPQKVTDKEPVCSS